MIGLIRSAMQYPLQGCFEYSSSKYKYEYSAYEYKYKYFKFVLELYSSTSTSTEYYISAVKDIEAIERVQRRFTKRLSGLRQCS